MNTETQSQQLPPPSDPPDHIGTAGATPSAIELTIRGASRRPSARVIVWALASVLTVAAAWYGRSLYQSFPLRRLPDVDLSQAIPAVRNAIVAARRAVVAAPRSGGAWGKLGLCLEAHKFYPAAAVCLAEAMRLEPREVLWVYNRGSLFMISDQFESERCFRLAGRLRPDLALPHLRLADLFLEQGRLEEAEAEFQEGLRIEPESARALLGLGMVAFSRGSIEAAGRWARQSFAQDPDRRTTAELLLRVFHREGDRDGAARQQAIVDRLSGQSDGWSDPFDEVVGRLRRDPEGLMEVASQLLRAGRSLEGIQVLEQLMSAFPDDAQSPVALAKALIEAEDYRRAAQVLDETLLRHPHSAEVHLQRGRVHALANQRESAIAEFRRAIELKPDFGDAYHHLGRNLKQTNNRDAAIAALREAVRFRPNFAEAYFDLGQLLVENGERDAAREALETAEKLEPEQRRTRELLDRLR